MKGFISADTLNAKRLHDAFKYTLKENGVFVLEIAVVTKRCFKKENDTTECIILKVHFSKNGDLLESNFSIRDVTLKNTYTFHDFERQIERKTHSLEYSFLENFCSYVSNILPDCYFTQEHGRDIIAAMMHFFTHEATRLHKVKITDFQRGRSPKRKKFKDALVRNILSKPNNKKIKRKKVA